MLLLLVVIPLLVCGYLIVSGILSDRHKATPGGRELSVEVVDDDDDVQEATSIRDDSPDPDGT